MNDTPKIKIVKKEDAPSRKLRKRKQKPEPVRNTARDMVATVSDWVTDFKNRKTAETKTAFDLFRANTPRTSES
jgi:hypothetical protein